MHDRADLDAERLTIATHTLVADTGAHIARLPGGLAATWAMVEATWRDLDDWRRLLAGKRAASPDVDVRPAMPGTVPGVRMPEIRNL